MISSADLPLNHRGAVYHLDLLPTEIADVIITVGDPERVEQVSRHFDTIELKRANREFVTHTGFIGQKRLTVLSTGIGIPNIDIVMHELDALVNIDLKARKPYEQTKELTLVRLGTTGGLQPDCQPGDVFISQFAVGFDGLMDYYQMDKSTSCQTLYTQLSKHLDNMSGPFYVTASNEALVKQFEGLGVKGITATCSGFYGPQGRQLRTPLHFPQFLEKLSTFELDGLVIQNLEMETAAILGLGSLLGHRCLSISVALANRLKGVFTTRVQQGVEQLIEKAIPYFA